MLLNISDIEFRHIFSDEKFHLPIKWNNVDFAHTLKKLLNSYYAKIKNEPLSGSCPSNIYTNTYKIKKVNSLLVSAVEEYLNGFPGKAFDEFIKLMRILQQTPLKVYYKSSTEHFYPTDRPDPLSLYRVTTVGDNIPYGRNRVFHTPYNMRSKVSTSRYSIAGFPSLYLGTSLELCCEEIQYNPHEQFGLAAKFQLAREFEDTNIEIRVVELAIKPQDFLNLERPLDNFAKYGRNVSKRVLESAEIRSAYLLWYPLIAACSFIRANKKDPFAAEYIIPQLLMQWVRSEMASFSTCNHNCHDSICYNHKLLIGIRYFSCASARASEMGFNYVFPTSGNQTKEAYCPILSDAFKLTNPHYIQEYENISACEYALSEDNDLDFIPCS